MGKGSGSTRASSSSSPRGLNTSGGEYMVDGRRMSQREFLRDYSDAGELEEIANRLYRNGLIVDPGDAAYETALNLAATDGGRSIEDSIEGTTDYFAQATRTYVQVGSNHLNAGEAMQKYGTDDMVRIPYGYKSLMEIIMELRTSSEQDIYRKYGR